MPRRQSGGAAPRATRDRGISVLSALIVFPLVLSAILFAIQYALVFHARGVLEAAAEDGLRAAQTTEGSPAAGQAAALGLVSRIANDLIDLENVSVGGDRTITVTIEASVSSIVPGWSPRITVDAQGPREEFRGL